MLNMARLQSHSILLVDDEEPVRELVKLALERAGHSVHSVGDGPAASKSLVGSAYDVLITDLLMPDHDGIELIRDVRRRYPALKIIAISGGGRIRGRDYLRLAKGMGANTVLEKPFLPADICDAVTRLFS